MDWNKIKSSYPDIWYKLIDYIADPEIFHERRIRIANDRIAADTKDNDDSWHEIDTLQMRDLYEFFESHDIYVVVMYNEWFGFYSYEIYSELKNEISGKFESRREAEIHAFNIAFDILDKQLAISN